MKIFKTIIAILLVSSFLLAASSETIATTHAIKNKSTTTSSNSTSTTSPTMKEELTEAFIHFIDTGNSDSILITLGDKTILIDGADSNEGTSIVAYIKAIGVKQIDYMINTHPDANHIGGLAEIMKEFKIGRLFVSNGDAETKTYRNVIETAGNLELSPEVPLENSKVMITENSSITFFNVKAIGKTKEASLIILFENGSDKFLFTGDARTEQESKFLEYFPDIDLLKVGHHGSNSSTSEKLIKKTKPEFAVILVGTGNKYGHPHKDVVNRLKKHKVEIYRTDVDGNIVFKSTGSKVTFESKDKSSTPTTTPKATTKATPKTTAKNSTTSASKTTTTKTREQTAITAITTKDHSTMIVTPSGKEISSTYKFKNCQEVGLYFTNGFSKSEYPELYRVNPARDGDKDGWACE